MSFTNLQPKFWLMDSKDGGKWHPSVDNDAVGVWDEGILSPHLWET